MTNLAIKGIIATQAMAQMSEAAGLESDADTYQVSALICSYRLSGECYNLVELRPRQSQHMENVVLVD